MKPYDPEMLAYLAGCMDSDGYFTVRRDTRAMRTTSATPTHVAMIGLRQVTPQVPELLHDAFGGHLGISKPSAPNGRPLICWHTTAVKAADACWALLPFLRIKPAQARVLIELQERKGKRQGHRNTDEEIAARDALWLAVRKLNRTGVAA